MKEYYELINKLNEATKVEYEQNITIVKEIWEDSKELDDKFLKYAFAIADKILFLAELEKTVTTEYYKENNIKDLQKTNEELFDELVEENYAKCFANPDFATEEFGLELGQILSVFYTNIRGLIEAAFSHKLYVMEIYVRKFIEIYELLKNRNSNVDEYKKIYRSIIDSTTIDETRINLMESYSPELSKYTNFIETADLSDLRYLYQFGKNITENEIKTAEFLHKYSDEKIRDLANSLVQAYIRSFTLSKKDISKKKTVTIMYNIGQELIVRELIKQFEEKGLKAIVNNPFTTAANRQYQYDHRFDNAIFFDEKYTNKVIEANKIAYEELKEIISAHSGPVYFDKFGERPFAPEQKKSCLKLNDEQQKLNQYFRIEFSQLKEKYSPRKDGSFCIIAFPVPEIGDKFEEIFEETSEINMMDSIHYEEIQQYLIDELDKADFVHVIGKDGNKTDIKVKMQELKDPKIQTNFENCGATVNIPVGEVFTSPKLTGTNGILHIKEIYLNDLRYENLELEFVDGYVKNYTCTNFVDEADNRSFIEENLLFPHKTLPLGEFAIGTNTSAYVMSKKYDILPIMPILIVEKMGPHFAIGDTCYSWEEDYPVYNPLDGKEITARENEKSALRKNDIQNAYTNCHTDITIPYDELGTIVVITKNGEKIDILRNGRFAVKGTEELNVPLDELDAKK
jgi:leucyl aminopeptidase (aminopeptidase T)